MLDINRNIEKAEPVQYPTHFRDVTAELDYRGGIAGGEPGCDLVLVERRWDHRERVIPSGQRDCCGGRAGGQGRDPRHDLDSIPAREAGEYIDEASVKKRVALTQQRYVTTIFELGGELGGCTIVNLNGRRSRAHRKADRDLALVPSDPGGDDRAGETGAMLRRRISDHRHRAQ